MVNFKVSEELAIGLAERPEAEGVTQKQIILAAAALPVDPLDPRDHTSRRRRAAA